MKLHMEHVNIRDVICNKLRKYNFLKKKILETTSKYNIVHEIHYKHFIFYFSDIIFLVFPFETRYLYF